MSNPLLLAFCIAILSSVAQAAAPASPATRAANAAATALLPADAEDEDFAARGFIATSPDAVIRGADGRPVWSFAAYDFVAGPAPETVHPSLWRQARLLARHGLFKVTDRIYQVRGFDIANMTIITGRTGLIVVDPLTSVETARAALALARAHLGEKRVTAVIYTHSHADHFAGVRGVVDAADVAAGRTPILAPEGFLEHAVSENFIAGAAMTRRASYQFGAALEPGPEGQMTSGIGRGVAGGTRSLIAPTDLIKATGETRVIDGVRFVFQMTPETEAPAEMNFHLPDFRALCMAENANVSMHNVLTPRGALVRDAKRWADGLTEAIRLFGATSDVMFASHGWPRFGSERVADYLASHRDAYKYLHDQSVRLMNMGLTGAEIAERIELPHALASRWFNRGYYGTMRHNSRAVYQRYLGWYDGNPAHLNPLPHEASAERYVAAMGGPKKVMKLARAASAKGDYRWAAELLDHLVFAEPRNAEARAALAEAHEQMAYQAESAIWRNMYLSAARELKSGVGASGGAALSVDFIAATPTAMIFDLLAVRLNPERAAAIGRRPRTMETSGPPVEGRAGKPGRDIGAADAPASGLGKEMHLNVRFADRAEDVAVTIRNGVLVHERGRHATADADVTLTRPQFLFLMLAPPALRAAPPPAAAGAVAPPRVVGNAAAWETFQTLFDAPDPDFAIVTP